MSVEAIEKELDNIQVVEVKNSGDTHLHVLGPSS
jgi:hypothetical protein